MLLYVVRHAWAEEPDEGRWPDDALRPLTRDGQKRFVKMAKPLNEVGIAPAMIATSPLVRCRQTAELLAEHLAGEPQITELEALAPGSDVEALLEWTSERAAAEIAWVGHAPDVGRLAGQL